MVERGGLELDVEEPEEELEIDVREVLEKDLELDVREDLEKELEKDLKKNLEELEEHEELEEGLLDNVI